jgi:hypothetical protein
MGVVYEKNNIIPTERDYDVVKYVPEGFVLYRLDSPGSVYYPGQFVGVRNGIKVNSPDSKWVLESIFDYAMKVYGRKAEQTVPAEFSQDEERGATLTHKDFIEGAKRVLKRFDYTPTFRDYKDLIFYSAYFILGKISNYSLVNIYDILNHINPIDDEFFSETNITLEDLEFLQILEPFSDEIKKFFEFHDVKNIPFGELEEEILYELENTLILSKKNLEFLKKLEVPDQVFNVLSPVFFSLRKAYKTGRYSDPLSFISEIVEEISSSLEDRRYYEEEEESLDIERIVNTFERILKKNDILATINSEFIEELYKYLLRENAVEDKQEFVEFLVKGFLLSLSRNQSEGDLLSRANSAYEYFSQLKYFDAKRNKRNIDDTEKDNFIIESPQSRIILKAVEIFKRASKENKDDENTKAPNSIEDLVNLLQDLFHEGGFHLAIEGEEISLDTASVLHTLILYPGLLRELIPISFFSYREPIHQFFAELEKEKSRDKLYEKYSNFVKLGLYTGHKLFLNDQDAYEIAVDRLTELIRNLKASSEVLQAIGAFKSAFLSSFIYRKEKVTVNGQETTIENWKFYLESRLEDIITSVIKKLGNYFIDKMMYREMTSIWGNLDRETIKKRREAFKAYLLSSASSSHYGKYLEYKGGTSKLVDRFSEAKRRLIEQFEEVNEDFQRNLFSIIKSLKREVGAISSLESELIAMVDNLGLIKAMVFKNEGQLENPFYIQDLLDQFRMLVSKFLIKGESIKYHLNDTSKNLLKVFLTSFAQRYDALLHYYFSLVSGSKAYTPKTLSLSFDHMNYSSRVIYSHSQVLKSLIGKFLERLQYTTGAEEYKLKAIPELFLNPQSPFYVSSFLLPSVYIEYYAQMLPIESVWEDEKETSVFLASLIPLFFHDFSGIRSRDYGNLYNVEGLPLESDNSLLEDEDFYVKPFYDKNGFVKFLLVQNETNFVLDPHMPVNFVKDLYGAGTVYVYEFSKAFANEFITRAENLIKKKYGRGINKEDFTFYDIKNAVRVLEEYEQDEDVQKLFKEVFRKTLLPVSGFYTSDEKTGIPLLFDKDNDYNNGHGSINMFSNPFLRRKPFSVVREVFSKLVDFYQEKDKNFYEMFKSFSPQIVFTLRSKDTKTFSGYYNSSSDGVISKRPSGKIVILISDSYELSPSGDYKEIKINFESGPNISILKRNFSGDERIPENNNGANYLQALIAHEFGHSIHALLLNEDNLMNKFLEKAYKNRKSEEEVSKIKESVREVSIEYAEKFLDLYKRIVSAFENSPNLKLKTRIEEMYKTVESLIKRFIKGEAVDYSDTRRESYPIYNALLMELNRLFISNNDLMKELETLINKIYEEGIHLDEYGIFVPDGTEIPSTALENYIIYREFKERYPLSYRVFVEMPMKLFEILKQL